MKKLFVVLSLVVTLLAGCSFFSGCSSILHKNYILTETEQQYFIPANTSFNARLVKNGPIEEVRRTQDTWAVDAGRLAKLEEMANSCTLNK